MKRKLLPILALALCSLFLFAACGGDEESIALDAIGEGAEAPPIRGEVRQPDAIFEPPEDLPEDAMVFSLNLPDEVSAGESFTAYVHLRNIEEKPISSISDMLIQFDGDLFEWDFEGEYEWLENMPFDSGEISSFTDDTLININPPNVLYDYSTRFQFDSIIDTTESGTLASLNLRVKDDVPAGESEFLFTISIVNDTALNEYIPGVNFTVISNTIRITG